MKPSDLPKDKRVSARVNKELLKIIIEKGLSVQKIIDLWVDEKLSLKIEDRREK